MLAFLVNKIVKDYLFSNVVLDVTMNGIRNLTCDYINVNVNPHMLCVTLSKCKLCIRFELCVLSVPQEGFRGC